MRGARRSSQRALFLGHGARRLRAGIGDERAAEQHEGQERDDAHAILLQVTLCFADTAARWLRTVLTMLA
jgi:hypothetical protein